MVFDKYNERTLCLKKYGKFSDRELQILQDDENTMEFVLALSLKPVDATLDHDYMDPDKKKTVIKYALDDAKFQINCLRASYQPELQDSHEEYKKHLRLLCRIQRQLEKQYAWARKQSQVKWEQAHRAH